jgi:hypothetical protein
VATLHLFHWHKKALADNANPNNVIQLLERLAPIQPKMQTFNTDITASTLEIMPWHLYIDIWSNARSLSKIAVLVDADRTEAEAVMRGTRRLGCCLVIALAEKVIHVLIPRVPGLFAALVVSLCQQICVMTRTICEVNRPELIDLITIVV